MSVEAGTIRQERAFGFGRVPAWFWLGIGVYALLLFNGSSLLNDSDTYWQIAVGQWILDHHAVPHADIYSFTRSGEPWISSSWLAQFLYATAHNRGGWAGPVMMAAGFIAVAFVLLAFLLGRRIPSTYAVLVALAALVLSTPHLLARPHVLVLPVVIAWVAGLLSASEAQRSPGLQLLPLIALWANLHGSFVFGLALVAPFALDALWNAQETQRGRLALRWLVFGVGALAASCATPYGWESILASRKILDLGEVLHLISEWMPADFSRISMFQAALFALIGGALYRGIRLSPPRILLVLLLLHMALSHVRNVEIFATLLPLVVLAPVVAQLRLQPDGRDIASLPVAPAMMLIVALGVASWAFSAYAGFAPSAVQSPVAAVDVLKDRQARRILNDVSFGGYLISCGLPVFIDGRAELYGETFVMAYDRALQLKDVNQFLDILKTWDIDAVLLTPSTPAVGLLDNISGWQRVYSDRNAVLHVRTAP